MDATAPNHELINTDDFKSYQIHAEMFNLTSQAKPSQPQAPKTGNTTPGFQRVEVIEIVDNGLVIETPARSCAQGHTLDIMLNVLNCATPISFQVAFKVTEIEPIDSGYQRTTIQLIKSGTSEWIAFCKLYSDRQTQTLELLKTIRGY
jgi:hypothetical protein